ncbi:MAG: outer membrane protein transport protein [Chromatiales bacterium]|jgi:long-chain fatty acid transport protein
MKKRLLVAAISAVLSAPAFATNGYAPIGVGQSAKGIGGAGIAYPQDTLAGGINPAGMVHLGNRWDVGAEIFMPDRGYTLNSPSPFAGSYDGTGSGLGESWFIIPEFGYNKMLSDDLSVGISVFGNGGLNTSYGTDHIFSAFAAQAGIPGAEVGIDLIQLFISPTVSYKVNERFSVGASLNLIAQSFEAKGLYAFTPFSSDPTAFTNNNHDNSYGASLRLGLMYEINDRVTLGATYQTKGWMTEFDDYAGLFADGGDFDIPQNYGIGIAIKATDRLDIAMDIMRIDYGSVGAIGNSPNVQKPFGADDGPGFGWDDQTIFKIGAVYQYNNQLALRAGYNYGENPVPTEGLGFALNTLAPGVSEHHLTLGFTWDLDENSSITGSYLHAFNSEVDGDFNVPDGQGGTVNLGSGYLEMSQNAFGISYNKRF